MLQGPIRLDGRVALVTGAGRGLGRAHALALAGRGARVVVNDVGSDPVGAGADPGVAEAVVQEIIEAGGAALPNAQSITSPEAARAIVRSTVNAYGRLDIVVNNAGHLRKKPFLDHTPEDLAALLAVHVTGSFFISQAAFEFMAAANYGRLVFTTSTGGLRGNPFVAAYGAAKAAVVGLANVVALAGAPHNIKANVISPYAATRMGKTQDVLDPDAYLTRQGEALAKRLPPELASAVVVYLASEVCQLNHTILTAGGGAVAVSAMVLGRGWRAAPGHALTPEDVRDHLPEILDLTQGTNPTTSDEEGSAFLNPGIADAPDD